MPTTDNNSYLDILKKLGIQKSQLHNKNEQMNNKHKIMQITSMMQKRQQEIKQENENYLRGRSQTPVNYKDLKTKYVHHYIAKDESLSKFLSDNKPKLKFNNISFKEEQLNKTIEVKKALKLHRKNLQLNETFDRKSSNAGSTERFLPMLNKDQLNSSQFTITTTNQFLNLDKIKINRVKEENRSLKDSIKQTVAEDDRGQQLSTKPSFMNFFKDKSKTNTTTSRTQLLSLQTSRAFLQQNADQSQISIRPSKQTHLIKSQEKHHHQAQITPSTSVKKISKIPKIKNVQYSGLKQNTVQFVKSHSNSSTVDGTANKQSEIAGEPLLYNGVTINSLQDLLKCINLSQNDEMKKPIVPPVNELSENYIDEKYFRMVQNVKPKTEYYKQGLGDKLLFLERVDRIKYDVLAEEQKMIDQIHKQELDIARQEKLRIQ